MFKVNDKGTRVTSSIVFSVNFEHILLLFEVFELLTLSMYYFCWKRNILKIVLILVFTEILKDFHRNIVLLTKYSWKIENKESH